jgi:protein TonB
MFENLVESNPHTEDLKRKGSFILGTMVLYGVLLIALFVVGVYMYDAHLENQNLELTTLVAPVPVPPQQADPEKPKEAPKPADKTPNQPQVATRTELVANVDRPEVAPKEISAEKSRVPPVPPGGAVLGRSNTDPVNTGGPIGPVVGSGGGGGGTPPVVPKDIDEPPPQPKPSPPKPTAPISGGVLNGKAISLPKPPYPPIAKAAHAGGTVQVQVTIDENGSVISAHAVSGHPLLQAAAVSAARGARFSPTKLSGQPVKVTGIITYNFVAQ